MFKTFCLQISDCYKLVSWLLINDPELYFHLFYIYNPNEHDKQQ